MNLREVLKKYGIVTNVGMIPVRWRELPDNWVELSWNHGIPECFSTEIFDAGQTVGTDNVDLYSFEINSQDGPPLYFRAIQFINIGGHTKRDHGCGPGARDEYEPFGGEL